MLPQGGGWSAEKEGVVSLSGGSFEGNSALTGGGMTAARDLDVTVAGTAWRRNTASYAASAGARVLAMGCPACA